MPLTPRQLEAKQNYDRGFRDGRRSQAPLPVDDMPAEIKRLREENARLREEIARLRAQATPKPIP